MHEDKHVAHFRFYGALNDFRSGCEKSTGSVVRYRFWGQPAVKDAIEAQGVPHPEVDLVLVNESPVPFNHALTAGDRVSVYPWIQSLPRPAVSQRPPIPTPPRFVCDVHLGQLARYLRMLGLDTRYSTNHSDPSLARISDEGDRALLTRDVGLLKRSRVELGMFVRAQDPRRQFQEVVGRFDLTDFADPLTLCMDCNAELGPAASEAIDEQVPPRAREAHDTFMQCPSCDSVYWSGSHVERMQGLIDDVVAATRDASESDANPPQ
jgi:hypothetical protein